jgi:hypothetical protein
LALCCSRTIVWPMWVQQTTQWKTVINNFVPPINTTKVELIKALHGKLLISIWTLSIRSFVYIGIILYSIFQTVLCINTNTQDYNKGNTDQKL